MIARITQEGFESDVSVMFWTPIFGEIYHPVRRGNTFVSTCPCFPPPPPAPRMGINNKMTERHDVIPQQPINAKCEGGTDMLTHRHTDKHTDNTYIFSPYDIKFTSVC